MKYLAIPSVLMLSLFLGVYLFVDEKHDHTMKTHFSAEWPIRSLEPIAEGRTSVIPRGLAPGTVPGDPLPPHLTGSSTAERNPPIKLNPHLIRFYRDKIQDNHFIEPKASEKV